LSFGLLRETIRVGGDSVLLGRAGRELLEVGYAPNAHSHCSCRVVCSCFADRIGGCHSASPEPVTMEGPSFFGPPGHGTFQATGLMCDTGIAVDVGGHAALTHPVDPGFNIQIYRQFTCAGGDADGEVFYMKLQVRVDDRRFPTFNWLLLGGAGSYEGFHANGHGYAAGPIEIGGEVVGVHDVYEGKSH
jgi:hypothetical protein